MWTTGNGVRTEVFVDTDTEELTIVEIHTYLAQANADYNEKTEKLSLTVFTGILKTPAVTEDTIVRTVALEDFDNITGYEKDDIVKVTFAGKDKVIQSVEDPEVISETEISAYSTNGDDADPTKVDVMSAITAEGTKC